MGQADEGKIQSFHIAPFSTFSRFTRQGLRGWRTFLPSRYGLMY